MLYLIGLGLHDAKDLSIKGLEAVKACESVYAELYTNAYDDIEGARHLAGKEIVILKRSEMEETRIQHILKEAQESNVALLVPGDPMVATTHVDLVLRARKASIDCKIIHSSSVYSAIGETGLQIYKFGKTASLVYPEKNYFPLTPYGILKENLERGLHTLLLLDVRAEEKRYMTVNEGINLLLEMEKQKKEGMFSLDTLCVGVARLGGESTIKAGKAGDLMKDVFGKPPHCIVVPGNLHYMEEEALDIFK